MLNDVLSNINIGSRGNAYILDSQGNIKIIAISQLIEDISSQTSLLSLNASIEAARDRKSVV